MTELEREVSGRKEERGMKFIAEPESHPDLEARGKVEEKMEPETERRWGRGREGGGGEETWGQRMRQVGGERGRDGARE